MQRIRRLNPIRWLGVVIALALGTSIACVAQEVGFIDFTQIVARTELQHPAPRSDDASERRGGTAAIHECGPRATEAGALRTTLIWLDRSEYAVGDHEEFEVRIQNVGSVQIEFRFRRIWRISNPQMRARNSDIPQRRWNCGSAVRTGTQIPGVRSLCMELTSIRVRY